MDVKNSESLFAVCNGCGKHIVGPYVSYREVFKTGFNELKFCDNCAKHIKQGGPIFFTTYSYESTTNSNYD